MMRMITKELVEDYRRHLMQEEYAAETVKKYQRDIRAFLGWLDVEAGAVPDAEACQPDAGAEAALEPEACRTAGEAGRDAEQTGGHARDGGRGCPSRPAAVDKGTAALWKAHLAQRGYAPATVNAMLSSLNGLLGYLGWDECRVKFLKIQRRAFRDQERELGRGEYVRLVEAAREVGNNRLALLLETVCATGIRVSEVRYVTVEALRRRRADISLKGKVRTILLPGKLCRKLMDYARRRGIAAGEVFVTRSGKGISRGQIWQEMKKLCGRAGVSPSKVFPHNLRHLFARTFYKASRDIVKLADVLGHSSIETTRIYLISSGETHARQMERLGLIS